MAVKVVIVFSALLLSSCVVTKQDKESTSELELYKRYSLSTCVSDGYESKEIVSDAAAAARGYLEFGNLDLEAYTEATFLGREFLNKEYKSKHGHKLTLMKCLDFINSEELQRIYDKYKNN